MSFGQHLEELRGVFLKCAIALAIGCCFGFYFAETVVKKLNVPLVTAINEYHLEDAKDRMIAEDGFVAPDLLPWFDREGYVPQKVRIDPGELVRVLQTAIPDFGDKIELRPYLYGPYDFDRQQLTSLAKRLAEQTPAEDSPAPQLKSVWDRLSEAEQSAIEKIAAADAATEADVQTMVDTFNKLAGSELNDDAAFAEMLTEPVGGLLSQFFPTEPRPLAKMKTYLAEHDDAATNRRLNRALLSGLFAEEMPPLKRRLEEMEMWMKSDFEPQSLATTDGFIIWLKAGLITGLIISLPAILFFLWTFVAAGLYPHEQKYVYMFLPISLALFVGGVLLAFFFVFQPVLGFLFSFNKSMGIAPQMRINDWLSFVLFLPLGFGIAFQLPLVMLFVNRIGLISVELYTQKWRIAVMAISVISMLLTPADPISMILMAGPLTALYFLGILMCHWMPSPSLNPFEENASPVT